MVPKMKVGDGRTLNTPAALLEGANISLDSALSLELIANEVGLQDPNISDILVPSNVLDSRYGSS
jgi:hypothetical protein